MDVTKPYEFIGSGAMDVTKPYEFIGFGAPGGEGATSACAQGHAVLIEGPRTGRAAGWARRALAMLVKRQAGKPRPPN